jgi:acetate---CoA ligase (ADP-forming)
MARPGALELIVGVRWDDLFGSVLMVGLGGIYAEILDDTVLGVAPLTHEDAWAMLRKLKCFPLLDGARGQAKRDVPALVDLLVDLSAHVAAAGAALREIDLNPVLVYPLGQGVTVIDALVLRVL